jgi:hypothetical protein
MALYPPSDPDALRVSSALDWSHVQRFQRIDLGHAPETITVRARAARHMARNGFSWPTFARDWQAGREEARRWIAWKKAVAGDNASAGYELVLNDVANYLAAIREEPKYQLARVPITDVQYGHPEPYSPRELEALGAYEAPSPFTSLRRRAMHVLSSFWGGRRVEQARAGRNDLDLDDLSLDMRLPGKRGLRRKVPLPSIIASPKRAVVPYLNERDRLFPDARTLWVTEDGQPFTAASLGRETWHMSVDLGFPVSFNRWRRSWQTTVRRCGVPKEIAKWLQGHQWGRDATDHYWTPTTEEVRDVLVRHRVPGFIRSRDTPLRVRRPLPVPFARELEAVVV